MNVSKLVVGLLAGMISFAVAAQNSGGARGNGGSEAVAGKHHDKHHGKHHDKHHDKHHGKHHDKHHSKHHDKHHGKHHDKR